MTSSSPRRTTQPARSTSPGGCHQPAAPSPDTRLAEINEIAATTGNDPELDTLLLRLHTETACRRGGALALRPVDLDPDQCLILLHEKGETTRWQPVSPTLMARDRHASRDGQLLRYASGQPITSRRYDHLWNRIGNHLPWVRAQQVSMHWIRHTTLTWVERNFGYAVAQAYAGHTSQAGDATSTYVRPSLHEVATALSVLTSDRPPGSCPGGPGLKVECPGGPGLKVEELAFDGGEKRFGKGVVPALAGAAAGQRHRVIAGQASELGRGVLAAPVGAGDHPRRRVAGRDGIGQRGGDQLGAQVIGDRVAADQSHGSPRPRLLADWSK
ncbi:MAG TPA: site-specific integrase [Streptosporangiaceae bacterium]|nr:site-specific integrase [Streptosporangiaceae bacterium]